ARVVAAPGAHRRPHRTASARPGTRGGMRRRRSLVVYAALVAAALVLVVAHVPRAAAAEPRLSQERVVLHTTLGDLVLAFYPDVAPRHVEQILRLVRLGAYDGTSFYRVYPSFVAQIGTVQARRDPLTAE